MLVHHGYFSRKINCTTDDSEKFIYSGIFPKKRYNNLSEKDKKTFPDRRPMRCNEHRRALAHGSPISQKSFIESGKKFE